MLIGEGGIALIARRVNEMGYLFHTRRVDHGIDGEIELVSPAGDALNRTVLVQSKARNRPFTSETDDSFRWTADPADLAYWLGGNAPVIVVLSHPADDEAWWLDVRASFGGAVPTKRTVTVDKRRQSFDGSAAEQIMRLGMAADCVADTGQPGVRAGDADPRRLGVHAAISMPGVSDEVPPRYVLRDVDTAEHGVRAKVAAAARRGGFVLLVGGSSVGKTRCAVEAVKALLPDWRLVHPSGPAEVAALARAPYPQMVVWLDELQRAEVRALLNAPSPVVVIGTLWPDLYTAYNRLPLSGADRHAREREVLDLAEVVRIAQDFTSAEKDRARAAAADDPRLRVALEAAGYGLTQTLAAAPQLVARWEDAQTVSPYAWAVLTAAMDAARLGARAPLSTEFLRAAAPGYCSRQQQAEAPENWFEKALVYASEKLHGTVAALSPAGAGMGQIAGYTVADYLIQHAGQERRSARVPASTWDAAVSHIRDPVDAARLAQSATGRLLDRHAIQLLRLAVDAGDGLAGFFLAGMLARRHELDELRARAVAGDWGASLVLAGLLALRGDLDELRARADAGNEDAAASLADLLAKRGDADGLRAMADIGGYAALRLATLLAERGDHDEAIQILRTRADAGDEDAAMELADLLAERGDLDEATCVLRAQADPGEKHVVLRLADLMEQQGDPVGAAQILRARADAGDEDAAKHLARLLGDREDLNELRTRADVGDKHAAEYLARLLADREDLNELHARASAGDEDAAASLADLLAKRGDADGLRAMADTGGYAALRLADLLEQQGDPVGAAQILRARADAGDEDAAIKLAGLLYVEGDLDGLRDLASTGVKDAAWYLADLLARCQDLDGLRILANAGDEHAAVELVGLLAERGDLQGAMQVLRARVDAGEGDASRLAELLVKQGRSEEAERLLRFGLNPGPDGLIACM